MHRNLYPFILASLGFVLVALAINMPLFEWQISGIVTDFPPDVQINPSPWITTFGESLGGSYIQVRIPNNSTPCRPEQLTSVIKRSHTDEALEQMVLNINRNIVPWLSEWSKFGLILFISAIYIWWSTKWYKRPTSEAVIGTAIAVFVLGFLINIWRLFFHKIGSPVCLGLDGTVTLDARLSKVHYETLIVFFAGILAELGVLGIILRQIMRAALERKKRPN